MPVCSVGAVVPDSATQWTVALQLLCLWHSPRKSTGVGSHALVQGDLPSQGSNPRLLRGRWILYLCAPGKPRYLCIILYIILFPVHSEGHKIVN